ncbi:MAG TPA: hypothetical protein VGE52_21880 [Pirellulales bacterium]
MSQPTYGDPNLAPPPRKPVYDVYTTMLMLALLALILACVMLGLELNKYEWKFKQGDVPNISATSAPTVDSLA